MTFHIPSAFQNRTKVSPEHRDTAASGVAAAALSPVSWKERQALPKGRAEFMGTHVFWRKKKWTAY